MRCVFHLHRYTFGNGPKGVTPDNRPGLPSTIEQHRVVRDAVASRDPVVAAQTMQDHIETIIGFWSPQLLGAVRAAPAAL